MFEVPEWLFEFHGHRCPFSVLGYRMGAAAMRELGAEKCYDHDLFVFSEMGVGHPQGCLQDGIQASTSATFGKGQMHKLFLGKVAATFYSPAKGAVRIYLRNEFADKLGAYEFFKLRKQGVAPSKVPAGVAGEVIEAVLNASEEELFKTERLSELSFNPIKPSFNKSKCDVCGEYVFERYVRTKDGKQVCVNCSGQAKVEPLLNIPR